MLLRRILTALALLTGLAATGAPASAAVADAVSEQVVTDIGKASGFGEPCFCKVERGLDPMKRWPLSDCRPARRSTVIFIPTVQFGPDRALE